MSPIKLTKETHPLWLTGPQWPAEHDLRHYSSSIVLLYVDFHGDWTPTVVSLGNLMNESFPHQWNGWGGGGGWGLSLSGFPILDNYGSWSVPKLPLLGVDTPTLIPVPYLGPMGPGYSLSRSARAHIVKSSSAGSTNSGKHWLRRQTVKTLSHVLYQRELVCVSTCMSSSFPLRDPHYKLSCLVEWVAAYFAW